MFYTVRDIQEKHTNIIKEYLDKGCLVCCHSDWAGIALCTPEKKDCLQNKNKPRRQVVA